MSQIQNCDRINKLLDETYKTIAEKEENKVKKNAHLNLTNGELHLMEEIGRHEEGGCTITVLAHSLSYALPSITVAVNKLEKKGYVNKARSPQDKRELRVSLTKRGEKINTVHQYIHRRISRGIANSFTEKEQEILIRGLEKIIELFKNDLYTGDQK